MPQSAVFSQFGRRVTSLGTWFTLLIATGSVSIAYFAALLMHVRPIHVIGMVAATALASLAGAILLIRRLDRRSAKVVAVLSYIVLTTGGVLAANGLDSKDTPRRDAVVTLIRLLRASGYYKYATVDSSGNAGVFARLDDAIFSQATLRVYPYDPKEFPQGAATRFMLAISPFLARQGIRVRNISDSIEIGGAYTLKINGVEHVLYSREEVPASGLGILCVNRICKIINSLLIEARSEERLRSASFRGAQYLVFLTEEQRALVGQYVTVTEQIE